MSRNVPAQGIWANAQTNVPGVEERIWWPFYSAKSYAIAGQTSLQFFGETYATATNGYDDTNMEAAGMMPGGKDFMIESIEIGFFPGILPGQGGLASATTGVPDFWNDVYTFCKSGYLKLTIGSKDYLIDGPLGKFPPRARLSGAAALSDATTAGAALLTSIDYAAAIGPTYGLSDLLIKRQNPFNVSLNWKTAQAMPSGTAARVVVTLNGWLQRAAQ